MFKDKFKILTNFIKNKTKGAENNKKSIENLVVFLILLIVTIIAINIIWGDNKNDKESAGDSNFKVLAENIEDTPNSNISNNKEYNLQEDIEDILSKMEGIGKVQVLITYSESSSIEAMYNETKTESSTQEQDSNGGTRIVESSDSKKEVITDKRKLASNKKNSYAKNRRRYCYSRRRGKCYNKNKYSSSCKCSNWTIYI